MEIKYKYGNNELKNQVQLLPQCPFCMTVHNLQSRYELSSTSRVQIWIRLFRIITSVYCILYERQGTPDPDPVGGSDHDLERKMKYPGHEKQSSIQPGLRCSMNNAV